MDVDQLREHYAAEPWGKLAIEAGFDPVNTESSARRAFEFCAKRIAGLTATGAKPVGETEAMPGSNGGFTMTVFRASDVPAGTPLFTAQQASAVKEQADAQFWQVEEYKIWKGINPDKPVWSSLNFVSRSWDDMMDLCDYLRGNNPDIVLRVIKCDWAENRKNCHSQCSTLLHDAGAPKVSIKPMKLSDGRTDFYVEIRVGDRVVHPHVFRDDEYKAAYHVALYDWLLNGKPKPDLMAFDEGDFPAQAYSDTGDEVQRLRFSLQKIASLTQTEGLLWWQIEARAALTGDPTDNPIST